MLAEKNESIKHSIVTLKELTADEKAKMQMEARERYRRDMVAAQDFGREQGIEQSKQEIQSLKNKLQKNNLRFQEESIKKEEQIRKVQEENTELGQRIRFLEKQLAKANKE